eukprot:CAMPEP_0181115900 /NCGR_PEP_ID=MMETSP1071-20121207/21670_1 /TAXON_ID=35127 /ORGANISM="Thalassiosira sp., Strain NH16" /LENGTH=97 /DNA_ID=CAMNT_0023200121 /DNA_START=126 /DNA_END=419 /DNA_ORIENTATION=-
MTQNESSSLHLLQECIVAGGEVSTDVNMSSMLPRCQARKNDEESSSPMNIFMDVLRSKASSIHQTYGSASSSGSSAAAHSALIQDFNLSSKVWASRN